MCGTQSIISALENAAGIKNEARAEKMRQMDCATHLTRLADSMPSIAMGKQRQRNSFGMCGTQSIIAAMENAAGIKNETATEKFFWNVRNAIHNCRYGKCCRNQEKATEKFFWNVRNAIHNCRYGKSDREILLECAERNP